MLRERILPHWGMVLWSGLIRKLSDLTGRRLRRMLFPFVMVVAVPATAEPLTAPDTEPPAPKHIFTLGVYFHSQGEKGDEALYFASPFLTKNRTPLNMEALFGPTAVIQMTVSIVYEHTDKPEYSEIEFQFECMSFTAKETNTISDEELWRQPVRMRVEEGFSLPRTVAFRDPIPATNWMETTAPVFMKARNLACNGDDMRTDMEDLQAKQAKADGTEKGTTRGALDRETVKSIMAKYGLKDEIGLVPSGSGNSVFYLVWDKFWPDRIHPDPSGRWAKHLTPEEHAAGIAKMEGMARETDRALSGSINRAQAELSQMDKMDAFRAEALKLRGGRKLTQDEVTLLGVWESKTESDVVLAMGEPARISRAGSQQFISYGKIYDNTVTVGNTYTGQIWTQGVWRTCNLQFVLIPDAAGIFRVADTKVTREGSADAVLANACKGLLVTPR